MLTGSLVRVRYARQRIIPVYAAVNDAANLALAEQLLDVFRGQDGHTRGELYDDLETAFGDAPGPFLQQGLAKLLEDRCEFEVVAGQPPEKLRESTFRAAAAARAAGPLDRNAVLTAVAGELELAPAEVEAGLFADLKSEQRLVRFKDISPNRLLQRY